MTTNIKGALEFASRLKSESARLDVELLICHVINKPRTFLFAWPEHELSAQQCDQFLALFKRRESGEPIAFILGEKDFWTLSLDVEPSTLIPRPDTELLVECALKHLPCEQVLKVLDLGTGTGAIALAIAKERPQANVVAVDYSAAAVALAKRNALKNHIENISIQQSDWFSHVAGQFDLIVSNPPYIAACDPHLNLGDVVFEPASALVADDMGLADIKHIAAQAVNFLRPGGAFLLEHGWQQAAQVQAILSQNQYSQITTQQDLNGNDRVTSGQLN